MTHLDQSAINAREWLLEARRTRSFAIPRTKDPLPAQLDGEEIDVLAMYWAAVIKLAPQPNPSVAPPAYVSHDDFRRCCAVLDDA
jgi:hypothetical protein